jgi:hypothetical protein
MNPTFPISELPDNEIRSQHHIHTANSIPMTLEEFNKKFELSPSYYNKHSNKPGIGGYMLGKYLETHKIEYFDEYLYPSDDKVKTFASRRKIKEITIRPSDVYIVYDNDSAYVVGFNILEKKFMINGGNAIIGYVFENEAEYKRSLQPPI